MENLERKLKRKALKKTFEELFDMEELLIVMLIIFAIVGAIIGGVKYKPVHYTDEQIKSYASIVEKTYPNNGPVILEEGTASLYSNEESRAVSFKVEEENSPKIIFKITEDGSAKLLDTLYSGAIFELLIVGILLYALLGCLAALIIWGILVGSICLIGTIEERISDSKKTYKEELERLKKEEFR